MTSVTRIEEHRFEGTTVEALREMLARAEAGKLRGVAFLVKTGPHRHRYGFAGDYAADPVQTLGCVTRMSFRLNERIEGRDDHETRTMPL